MAPINRATGLRKRQAIHSASRTMFVWVAVASIAVSFLLVGAQFLYSQFMFNNKVLSAKDKAARTLAEDKDNVEKLKENFGPLDAGTNKNVNSAKVLSALPSELDTSAFGTSLQQIIAPRSGVTLESVAINQNQAGVDIQVSSEPTPQEIAVSVTVSGQYDQIGEFVKDLELTIRPIKVRTISVTGSDSNTRAALEIITYYQPAKKVELRKQEIKQ